MSSKKIIHTTNAPEAIGPYNQAVTYAGIVYCSGQIPIEPKTGKLLVTNIETQTRQVMENLEAVLVAAGSSLDKVLKCSIFLSDMDSFSAVNEVYGSFFASAPPARETVAVKTLPKNVDVEISCIAHL